MKRLLLFIALFCPMLALAQGIGPLPVLHGIGPIVGMCAQGSLYTNDSNGDFYTCKNGVWALAVSGGGGGVTSINALNGAITILPGSGITVTNGAGTITIAATTTGTIAGTIAAGQTAFGTAANTIGGSNNYFWDNTNQRLDINRNATGGFTPQGVFNIRGDGGNGNCDGIATPCGFYQEQNSDASWTRVVRRSDNATLTTNYQEFYTTGAGISTWTGLAFKDATHQAGLTFIDQAGRFIFNGISGASTATMDMNASTGSATWNTNGTRGIVFNGTGGIDIGVVAGQPTRIGNFGMTTFASVASTGAITAPSYSTTTNCADSAGAAACGSAAAGAFVIDPATTSTIVSTTAVTANSEIFVQYDSSLGTRLGVTCNVTVGIPQVTARTAGASFTVTIPVGPVTNPECISYRIEN